MSLLCKLFGHVSLEHDGWSGGVGYAKIASSTRDGMGTVHYYLKAECPRCGKEYRICNVHELSKKVK